MVFSMLVLLAHSTKYPFLKSKNGFFVTLIIPAAILLITQTIATNLYLSLGLIGALSIVRYRTPIKSTYELAYLFSLIAIGIITGVNPSTAFFLTIILVLIPFAHSFASWIKPGLFQSEFRSYSEGKVEALVEIESLNLNFLSRYEANLLRIDFDNSTNISTLLLVFETVSQATEYIGAIEDKVTKYSLSHV